MNFQTIAPVPNEKELLNYAFGKARAKGNKKLNGDHLQIIKAREGLKLDVVKDALNERLDKIIKDFPSVDQLSPFYYKMITLTLELSMLKKSLGAVNWVQQKLRFFHREYASKIGREKNYGQVKLLLKQYYGRISSLLKQIRENLQYLEYSRRILKSYPDIKDIPTICIYGFPNVGKSTLLNKLAGTRAEVAAYAFTTKGINAGYLKVDGKKIQLLDVPGTLDRPDKMNNIERIAELVLKELADVIIYVFDLSEYCGYSLKDQLRLYQNVNKNTYGKQVLVYLSKQDLLDPQMVQDWKMKHYTLDELKEIVLKLERKKVETESTEINDNINTEEIAEMKEAG